MGKHLRSLFIVCATLVASCCSSNAFGQSCAGNGGYQFYVPPYYGAPSYYPPAWPTRRPAANQNYNLTESIRIRSAAHAFEGKVFNVVASCALDQRTIDEVSQGDGEVRRILTSASPATSLILGPQGELIAEPQVGGEGLVIAEIDVSLSIEQKQIHDVVGYYNRFDIFRLTVDQRPNRPVTLIRDEASQGETAQIDKRRPVATLAVGRGSTSGRDQTSISTLNMSAF